MYNEQSIRFLVRRRIIDAAEGRLIGVIEEFNKAFNILEKYEFTVSIFGSARVLPSVDSYKLAYQTAQILANKGYAIVTGGGGGIMEAGNKGAFDAGKPSIGFNIELPTEQHLNAYTTEHYSFEHFFGRKVALTLNASAYIFFPGGFGTLDELFEILTLEQNYIVPRVPIILYDSNFWQPLLNYFHQTLATQNQTISQKDLAIIKICDSIDEVVKIVDEYKQESLVEPVVPKFSKLVNKSLIGVNQT